MIRGHLHSIGALIAGKPVTFFNPEAAAAEPDKLHGGYIAFEIPAPAAGVLQPAEYSWSSEHGGTYDADTGEWIEGGP